MYAQYSNVSEVENCVHFYFISSTQYRYAFRLFKNEQYACFHLKVLFTSFPHDTNLIQKKKLNLPHAPNRLSKRVFESLTCEVQVILWQTIQYHDFGLFLQKSFEVLKKKNLLAEGL